MKKKNIYILICILTLAIFAGFLDYPQAWEKMAKAWNSKIPVKISEQFLNVPFKLGLDLQGGTHLVYQADLSGIEQKDYSSAMQGLKDVMERRVNIFGVKEPVVQVEEQSQRLIIELAGISNVEEAIKMIGEVPFLEFRQQRTEEETKIILEKAKELEGKTLEEAQKIDNWEIGLQDPYFKSTNLTGKYLKKAEVTFDQTTYKPLISLQFNDDGAKLFGELTKANVGKPIAIYIDNELLSAPTVQEEIAGGNAQITGNFTLKEAQTLVRNLNAGALPVPISLMSQQTVGPTLGDASLKQSLKAGIIGFLAVILFVIVLYKFPGLLSSFALLIYVILTLAAFKLVGVTLTLAGIAGFILSIGMAIDANILVFARMKEELAQGKTVPIAIEEAFRRAWPSIRDGNLTTLVVAAIMFFIGSSFIKGFALTLSIGVLLSMFSALVITRDFMRIFIGTKLEKIMRP